MLNCLLRCWRWGSGGKWLRGSDPGDGDGASWRPSSTDLRLEENARRREMARFRPGPCPPCRRGVEAAGGMMNAATTVSRRLGSLPCFLWGISNYNFLGFFSSRSATFSIPALGSGRAGGPLCGRAVAAGRPAHRPPAGHRLPAALQSVNQHKQISKSAAALIREAGAFV